jgi:hypothetical protein
MEFVDIVRKVAEAMQAIDGADHEINASRRSGEVYGPGVPTRTETQFVEHLASWWQDTYPSDFAAKELNPIRREVRYPHDPIEPKAKLDLEFYEPNSDFTQPHWAIEFKRLQLVGNNGKTNDHPVQKLLSPYLKDRSVRHDIDRLRRNPMGLRQAVIGYGFEYDKSSINLAKSKFPDQLQTVKNLESVCRSVDRNTYEYSVLPLIELADEIYSGLGLVKRVVKISFTDLWRHPTGGSGWVFGWEIIPILR